jgi:UDPglucose--hexose-1-phosphate uridylyltransferase
MDSELRKDYLLNKYVIITPGRSKRPRDIAEETVMRHNQPCVFCPQVIKQKKVTDRIGDKNNWQVLSLPNDYPAVTLTNKKAYGAQEVIIDTPKHGVELGELNESEILDVLKMYRRRTLALSKIKGLDYIIIFKNNGSKAGASIAHAHSQIFATNIIPPEVQEEIAAAINYQMENKRNAYLDIIKKEIKSPRKIYADKLVAAFCPYASQFHYEAWILPRRFADNITELTETELKAFAKVLKKILGKLHRLNLNYNFFMHQVISNSNQYFYLKIQPRDSIWAGVELGSGLVINSVAPETAAKFYRK